MYVNPKSGLVMGQMGEGVPMAAMHFGFRRNGQELVRLA
jgi:hypothetical protein